MLSVIIWSIFPKIKINPSLHRIYGDKTNTNEALTYFSVPQYYLLKEYSTTLIFEGLSMMALMMYIFRAEEEGLAW